MARHDMDLQTAMTVYLLVISSAAGLGLVAWLLLTVAQMAQEYAAAVGASGISIAFGLRRKG
jgi:hypothetical protein